jgi:putative hydrolase of the HAD superfamily
MVKTVPKTLKVKAVLFDLGGTLVYQQPFEPFQRILQNNGVFKSIEEIREAFEKGSKEFDVEKYKALSSHEFYSEWNMTILRHLGISRSVRRLAEEIDLQWFNFSKVHVYPEVRDSLRRFKQMGLKLGIVTRGYELDLEQILPRAGLEEFFDVCVDSDTTGEMKPSPETFKHALKQLDVKPEEAVFVGDNLEQDYFGALKVGMKAFLIQREGKPAAGVKAIASLREIFDVL